MATEKEKKEKKEKEKKEKKKEKKIPTTVMETSNAEITTITLGSSGCVKLSPWPEFLPWMFLGRVGYQSPICA